MKKTILLLFVVCNFVANAQSKKVGESEIAINKLINGTLFTPENHSSKTKLVIMISGSGPTDRNGNQMGATSNFAKNLATAIAAQGNAVFTYDKRMFAEMASGTLKEETMRFDDGIADAKDVITYFKSQKKYSKIIVAGHSEGSMVGMVAALGNADGFISLAGAGRPADEILLEQIGKQAPNLKDEVQKNLDLLKKGETFTLENQMLASIFRESVQPYMISWFKYNPQVEIKKLKIPVLLVNGTKDIQVPVKDAELLKGAKPDAQIAVINNMNHIFREIKGDDTENYKSYSDTSLPVMDQLVTVVNQFIKSI